MLPVRRVDDRAYGFAGPYGYIPIPVENAAGRAEYMRCQKAIAIRAGPLRAALLARSDLLVQVAGYQ